MTDYPRWDKKYHFSNIFLCDHDGEFKSFNLSGPSIKGKKERMRLIKFEFQRWKVSEKGCDGKNILPKNVGVNKGAYCRYEIVDDPKDALFGAESSLSRVPATTSPSSCSFVHVRTDVLHLDHDARPSSLRYSGFKLPRVGVGFVEGEVPLWKSYLTYLAVCLVESEHPFSRVDTLGPTGCPWFKVLEVVGAACREHLTFGDLKILLSEEHGAPHLYDSFVRDAQLVTACLAKARGTGPAGANPSPDSFKFGRSDPWSPAYLFGKGSVTTFHDRHFASNTWSKCKTGKLLIRLFPFDFWEILNNPSSEEKLCAFLEKMQNPLERMKLSLDVQYGKKLLLECASSPSSLSSRPLRAFCYLELPGNFQIYRNFFVNDLIGPLKREGSTAKILTKHSLVVRMSKKRKTLEPAKLSETLVALEEAGLLIPLSDFSKTFLFSDPKSLIGLYSPSEQYLRAMEVIRTGLRLEENSFSALGCASRRERVIKFLARLNDRGLYEFAKARRVPSSASLYVADAEKCELNSEQGEALLSALIFPVVCVVGLAGTGKTLVAEALFEFFLIDTMRSEEALDGDDEEDDGDVRRSSRRILRDGDAVLALTHGGCMAESLRERNLGKAQTIHSSLKRAAESRCDVLVLSDPRFREKDPLAFDPEKIKILIVDEFSNVSDALACDLLSPSNFPNLETVVHFFDPVQTGPIEQGSLALDYLRIFPDVAGRLRQRSTEFAKNLDKSLFDGLLEDFENDVRSSKNPGFSLALLKKISPFSYASSVFSVLPRSAPNKDGFRANSFGVTACLKNKLRFEENSLVARNCAKVISGGDLVRLEFDERQLSSFVHFQCPSLSTSVILTYLKGKLKEIPQFKEDTDDGADERSGCCLDLLFDEVRKDWDDAQHPSQNPPHQKERWFGLGFTNSDCAQVNLLCQSICASFQLPSQLALDLVARPTSSPLLAKGNKILFREKHAISLKNEKNFGLPWADVEGFVTVLHTFYGKLELHSEFSPKKTDYFNKKIYGLGPSKEGWDELDLYADDASDAPPAGDNFLNLGDPRKSVLELLRANPKAVEEWEKRLRNCAAASFPKFDAAYNGTRLRLRGVVEWRGDFEDRLASAMVIFRRTQAKLCKLMVRATATKTSGKGSVTNKRLVRRANFASYFSLFRPSFVVDLICSQVASPWFCPSFGKGLCPLVENEGPDATGYDNPLEACVSYFPREERFAKEIVLSKLEQTWNRRLLLLSIEGKLYPLPSEKKFPGALSCGWAVTVNYSQGRECGLAVLVAPGKEGPDPLRSKKYSGFDRTHANVAISRAPKFVLLGSRFLLDEIASRNNDGLSRRNSAVYFLLKSLRSN